MSETTTSNTLEVLAEALDRIVEHRCPLCGDELASSWELGCMFVPGAMECRKLRLRDDHPEKKLCEAKAKILSAAKLLLGTYR